MRCFYATTEAGQMGEEREYYWAILCMFGGAGLPPIGLALWWKGREREGITVFLAGLSIAALCLVSRIAA